MPTIERALVEYARRRGQPLAEARRLAESRIAWAVEEVVSGRDSMHAIDALEPELRPFAQARVNERLAAGESAEGVRIFVGAGTWGR